MKIQAPQNENYAATVIKISVINKLEGRDLIVGVPLLGYQAIVSKDATVGDIGILFTAETKLSEEYARENNLHRHGDKNADPYKTGYLEDHRRIKAVKFAGHKSNALFMPLESLEFTGVNIDDLKEGDVFDQLNGHEICRKHVVASKSNDRTEKNKNKEFKRVDEKFLPKHYDTDNYWRHQHVIKPNRNIIVTQKLHGTSIRIGNTIAKRQLNLAETVLKKLGIKVQETEFAHVYGSRNVIKDSNNPRSQHFYGTDVFTEEGSKIDDLVPDNFILYGELIGWIPETGAPIQKNYTYRIPKNTSELYVYRVAIVTNQGLLVDLSWDQVKEFCRDRGLKTVPELWTGKHRYFKVDDWVDKTYSEEFPQAVPLDDESPCDEGVCVRVDGMAAYILKAKSPLFFEHETKMNDQGIVDLEEQQKEKV